MSDGALAGVGNHPGPLRQAEDVQNESDFSVSHDAGAGKGLDRLELLTKGFDDNFLRIVDLIHYQPELALICLQHNDLDRAIAIRWGIGVCRQLKCATEI